ncbi:MAG: putative transposase [Halanaerobiales bacterium]|nr:putative transposase [Halanaerobiales bacterium]
MFLDTGTVAELCGISERAVQKNANNGKYGQVKYVEGMGRGGQVMKINLFNLPPEAIARHLAQEEKPDDDIYIPYSVGDFAEWAREEGIIKKKMVDLADELIEEFMAEGMGKTKATRKACKVVKASYPDRPFSTKTYYRDKKILKEEGIVGLMDRRGLKKSSTPEGVPENINPDAWWLFLKLYLTENQLSISECYRTVKTKAKIEGWGKIPSERTMRRYVKDPRYLKPQVKIALREGKTAFKNKVLPYIERDRTLLKSNEVWVGDHRQFDVFVLMEDGSIKAPWLTAWLDMRSSVFVGYTITLNPNLNTIMESFGRAIEEYGAPEHIIIDNGKDYRAKIFAGGRVKESEKKISYDQDQATSMIEALKITPHFAIPFNARAKIIEPTFKIVKDTFDRKFKTFRGGNVQERKESLEDILKDKSNIIPFEDFKETFAKWLDVDYHERPQTGEAMNGKSPRVVYKNNLKKTRWISEKDLAFLMTKSPGTRKVRRNGIQLFNQNYTSPELAQYYGQDVIVRYKSDDLTKVYICDLKDNLICMAYAIEKSHPIFADEKQMKEYHSMRKKIEQPVKEFKEHLVQVKEYTLEDQLKDKEKEKRRRMQAEDPVDNPKVVELIKPDFHDSLKKMDKQQNKQARESAATKGQDDNITELFKMFTEEQKEKIDREKQKKQDMKELRKALGFDF